MGSKWRIAKHYGKPDGTVIEPFAGGACYSLYWNVPNVILYDINPIIAGIWRYLIAAKESEISSLPLTFDCVDDLPIPQEAKWLIGFWITKGTVHPNRTWSAWGRRYRNGSDCKVWGAPVRARIAKQVNEIRRWQIEERDYKQCPDVEATWFIDPPYMVAGHKYPFSDIDYSELAAFCRERMGRVIVCEAKGATWLPFRDLVSARGTLRNSEEVVWECL